MPIYHTYTDNDLLQLLQQSDAKAFTEIYHRYWDKLFYKAGKKLNDLSGAEGLVQDIFLDLWQRRESLNIQGEISGYLAVALKYKVINVQAKQCRAEAYKKYASRHLPQQDNSTEEWLSFEELRERLAALIAQLPQKCRIVYQLREEGYTQKEIAWHMNISENTVETHIGRALKSIRTGFNQFFSLPFFFLSPIFFFYFF